ncbi:MAG: hypothetical protein RI894_2091 [Bacteroidota bacterium]
MFKFKQFSICQDRCAMKIGTDSVLFGAWIPVDSAVSKVLDIGAGTGILSLMLAQRNAFIQIMGLEIAADAAEQARENIKNSPFHQRITVENTALQDYKTPESGLFELIVSNPPFFETGKSLASPDEKRAQARNTNTLSQHDLVVHSCRLLAENGSLIVLLPPQESLHFIVKATEFNLRLRHRTNIKTRPTKPVERVLLVFSFDTYFKKSTCKFTEDTLLTRQENGEYTSEYKALTADFYLDF